jgi:hypothetical protein
MLSSSARYSSSRKVIIRSFPCVLSHRSACIYWPKVGERDAADSAPAKGKGHRCHRHKTIKAIAQDRRSIVIDVKRGSRSFTTRRAQPSGTFVNFPKESHPGTDETPEYSVLVFAGWYLRSTARIY